MNAATPSGPFATAEVTDTTAYEAEHTAAERYNALIDAVHRGCEGLDNWAAQCILSAVAPVLRRQISDDLTAMCSFYGLPCGGADDCVHVLAASIAVRGMA